MRILHTADWHLGKKLGRTDRTSEFEQVIGEVVDIARDQKVDLAIVAGDIFDRAAPPIDVLRFGVDALMRLADAANNVVVITGNHDSAHLFEFLEPLVTHRGVAVVPRLRRPRAGGLIRVASQDGKEATSVACFPFLHEAEVIEDFMADSEEWFKDYAQKIRAISLALCEAIDPSDIGVLAGHFFVDGTEIAGSERRIHIGQQYAASSQAIPPSVHYAALGHVHKAQEIPNAPVRARYSGSLLQLDFSERSHAKEVVVVDAVFGRPPKVASIGLKGGRRLIRVEDDLESLKARAREFGDALLDVRVKTDGPVPGLPYQVRQFLPNALFVQATYERILLDSPDVNPSKTIATQYADYFQLAHGVAPPAELVDLMAELEREVDSASA